MGKGMSIATAFLGITEICFFPLIQWQYEFFNSHFLSSISLVQTLHVIRVFLQTSDVIEIFV
jgi:hypothetical protein